MTDLPQQQDASEENPTQLTGAEPYAPGPVEPVIPEPEPVNLEPAKELFEVPAVPEPVFDIPQVPEPVFEAPKAPEPVFEVPHTPAEPVFQAPPAPQQSFTPPPPVTQNFAPPPPPPSQSFSAPVAPPPAKKGLSKGWIIAIVVLLLLCCCCVVSVFLAYTYGDQILENMDLTYLQSLLMLV